MSQGPIAEGSSTASYIAAIMPEPIELAAHGEVGSLRNLARLAYAEACETDGASRLAHLAEALTFSRLAAAADRSPGDVSAAVFLYGLLAGDCRNLGEVEQADEWEARGFLLAEIAAEAGDKEMSDLVLRASDGLSPNIHRRAHERRAHELRTSNQFWFASSPPIFTRNNFDPRDT